MTKEELLSEMYRLVNRFDRDILQLMNMLRENGELNDEINVSLSDKFDIGGMQQTSFEPEIGGGTRARSPALRSSVALLNMLPVKRDWFIYLRLVKSE